MLKGSFNNHSNQIGNDVFKGYHVQINARSEKDVKEEEIVKRVEKAAGAFLHQKKVDNQSTENAPAASGITYEKRGIDQSTESKPSASRVTYEKRNDNQSTENKPAASTIAYEKRAENQSTENAPAASSLPRYAQPSAPVSSGGVRSLAARVAPAPAAAPVAVAPSRAKPIPEPEPQFAELAPEPEASYESVATESHEEEALQVYEEAAEESYQEPAAEQEQPADTQSEDPYPVGSRVLAQYSGDSQWYEATVEQSQDGQYLVNYGEVFNNETEWVASSGMQPL